MKAAAPFLEDCCCGVLCVEKDLQKCDGVAGDVAYGVSYYKEENENKERTKENKEKEENPSSSSSERKFKKEKKLAFFFRFYKLPCEGQKKRQSCLMCEKNSFFLFALQKIL